MLVSWPLSAGWVPFKAREPRCEPRPSERLDVVNPSFEQRFMLTANSHQDVPQAVNGFLVLVFFFVDDKHFDLNREKLIHIFSFIIFSVIYFHPGCKLVRE